MDFHRKHGNNNCFSRRYAMDDKMAQKLIKVVQHPEDSPYSEAVELTRTYAGSAGAQASAIPVVFEKMFELFITGRGQG